MIQPTMIQPVISQILIRKARHKLMRAVCMGSVALLITLCKVARADEPASILDGFNLGGYASASVTAPRDDTVEAAINEISLLLRWEGDSRFKFLGELELEHPLTWNEGQRFNHKNAYLDLERFYLDYNLSEKLNLRAGRFLTPAGRWNLLHAAPLVWTSSRPLVTSRLFPASINGLMFYGSTPLKNKALEYSFFAETLKDQLIDDDEIQFKDVGGARFTLNNSINVGLTVMTLRETDPRSPSYRLIGLDFLTQIDRLELSGEGYFRFTGNGRDGGSGAYVQSAYHLGNQWYGLARLETFQSPRDGSAERWLVGATKRLKPNQLLKMEWIGGSGNLPDAPRGFIGSFAVLF